MPHCIPFRYLIFHAGSRRPLGWRRAERRGRRRILDATSPDGLLGTSGKAGR